MENRSQVAVGTPVETLRVQGVLKPLEIEVLSDGKVVRVIKIPDPRERYMKTWMELDQPVSRAT